MNGELKDLEKRIEALEKWAASLHSNRKNKENFLKDKDIITGITTGLQWLQGPQQRLFYDHALQWIEERACDGWRLPTLDEMYEFSPSYTMLERKDLSFREVWIAGDTHQDKDIYPRGKEKKNITFAPVFSLYPWQGDGFERIDTIAANVLAVREKED